MCYLIHPVEKNTISIKEKNELILNKNNEILNVDNFVVDLILNNIKFKILDLNYLMENESKEWIGFYSVDNWKKLFWVLGYNIESYNKEKDVMGEILKEKSEVVLFYIQNIVVLVSEFKKGENFNRFFILCEYYEKNILENENNQIFKNIMINFKKEWSII